MKQWCPLYVFLYSYEFVSNLSWPDTGAVNSPLPGQHGHHFPDDIFKYIFLNENVWIWIKVSLKFVPKGPINNILALVQIMPWRRSGDKPLSEPMMVSLMTHICVTRPQWVNALNDISNTFHYQLIGLITLYFNIITSMRMHLCLNGYFAICSVLSGNYDSCKATVKAIASDYISPGMVINRGISLETNVIEIKHICGIPSPVTSDKDASTCTPVVQTHQQLQAIFITPSLVPTNELSVEVILWTWMTAALLPGPGL